MHKLFQLIYLSDLAPGQEPALPAILATAVRRNAQDDITGMLLYSGGNIMQVLEGDEDAVRLTYERIGQDTRHRNATVILEEEITERSFPDWRMGYKHLDPAVVRSVPRFAPFFQVGFKLDAIKARPGIAKEMLVFFATKGS